MEVCGVASLETYWEIVSRMVRAVGSGKTRLTQRIIRCVAGVEKVLNVFRCAYIHLHSFSSKTHIFEADTLIVSLSAFDDKPIVAY